MIGQARPRCIICNLEDGACICAHIQPARDAAEGAAKCQYCDYPIKCPRCGTAPPKPAPDAVREAQIRRNYADSATHAAIATACEVACAGGSAQDVVKALRERFSTPVPPADGAKEIRWQRVNGEPFEYAIQQGPHGDEFVKLLNGSCLRRPVQSGAGERDD